MASPDIKMNTPDHIMRVRPTRKTPPSPDKRMVPIESVRKTLVFDEEQINTPSHLLQTIEMYHNREKHQCRAKFNVVFPAFTRDESFLMFPENKEVKKEGCTAIKCGDSVTFTKKTRTRFTLHIGLNGQLLVESLKDGSFLRVLHINPQGWSFYMDAREAIVHSFSTSEECCLDKKSVTERLKSISPQGIIKRDFSIFSIQSTLYQGMSIQAFSESPRSVLLETIESCLYCL